MAYEDFMWANTDLPFEEIHEALFKDMDVQNDEEWPGWIKGNGFDCYMSHNRVANKAAWYLEKPATLEVTFRYRGGYENAMRVVLNWFKNTEADTALDFNYEMLVLLRTGGRLIKNVHADATIRSEILGLSDLRFVEADLGIGFVEDDVFIESGHDAPEVMARFSQLLFDDQESKIRERNTGYGEICAEVKRDAFQIGTFRYRPYRWSLKWKRGDDRYPFLANRYIDVFYTKGRGIPLKTNGAYDVSIRDDTLRAVAGLIRTTDYNLLVEFSDPTRDVLMYHAGELTLYEDSCWTEERLALFEGIPYQFSAPIP